VTGGDVADFPALLGIEPVVQEDGSTRCELAVAPEHMNRFGALHGGVLYSMADTGMAYAVIPTLGEGEACATIEVKIVYLAPVTSGRVVAVTRIVQRGRRVVVLETDVQNVAERGERLVAKALGTFAVFERR
jgi:acyl-CoA thioesterase